MFNFLETMESFGSRPAIKNLNGDDSLELSYATYLNQIKAAAYNLNETFGDLKGRHIGLLCDSNYEYTVLLAALLFSRAVVVPLNILETVDNLDFAISNSEIEAIILEDKYSAKVEGDILKINKEALLSSFDGQMQLVDFSDEEAENPLMIIYTSGTTSLSKGVVLSVDSLFGTMKSVINSDFEGGADRLLGLRVYLNFPLYHVAGVVAWLATCENGCETYMSHDSKNILFDLENEHIDAAAVTPAVLNLWSKTLKRGKIDRLGGLGLIVSAGAKVNPDTVQIFLDKGIKFGQFYGMTETGGNVTCNFDIKDHLHSVGIPVGGVEVSIVDGELCISGRGLMLGYYNNPLDTAACLENGLLHTGDLGYIDEDGYVYITGRKKNLIILSSGENVSPEELEKLLYESKKVIECKVFEAEDRIIASVYCLMEDMTFVKEYVDQLNKTLPIYKRIYKVDFKSQELEKTSSGKIKR